MRILHFSASHYVDDKGMAVHVKNMAKRLSRRHDIARVIDKWEKVSKVISEVKS